MSSVWQNQLGIVVKIQTNGMYGAVNGNDRTPKLKFITLHIKATTNSSKFYKYQSTLLPLPLESPEESAQHRHYMNPSFKKKTKEHTLIGLHREVTS